MLFCNPLNCEWVFGYFIITIRIIPILFKKRKVAIAKSVTECDSKVSYIPAAIRFLVEIFSVINYTVTTGI